MSEALERRIDTELSRLTFIDPHTHIDPKAPAARSLSDLLGYHYYTELVHSAGISREKIEGIGLSDVERMATIVEGLAMLTNTVQYSWLMEIARGLFGFEHDTLGPTTWKSLADAVSKATAEPHWSDTVLAKSRIESVFLTNDFDDPLEGFDTARYVPCLRVDELVFHLARPEVRSRLGSVSGIEPVSRDSVHRAIEERFEFFLKKGARAAAISLPPDFRPRRVPKEEARGAMNRMLQEGNDVDHSTRSIVAADLFWKIVECCQSHALPMDLMIGVRRGVYAAGVHQGQDLFDGRLSLADYAELFNAFPDVLFPISVLSQPLNHELVSFAWIFPNVLPFGHWWYSNTPSSIERDLEQRIEAVPRTKLLGYYSDMYKLEFGYPKFAMYRRILARTLAKRYVVEQRWTEEAAVDLGTDLLKRNTERVFYAKKLDASS